jgi:ABC-2 type transport system ATP-binding protein
MKKADIGLIGLAVMGENLVLNMERNGFTCAVYNRTVEKVDNFVNGRGAGKKFIGCHSIQELCDNLESPRRIMMMVKAGAAVDALIDQLVPYLDKGDILIDGHSVKKEPLLCKSIIAYIPDNPDLPEYLTGIQYLNFIADVYGLSESVRTEKIKKYAEAFEITSALGDLISSYSHGMKQKLAIISALIHSPKLMLLDEAFVGLDPKAALTLKEIMRELCENGGAVFFSTHVLDVTEKLCNRIAIIKDAQLVASGDTDTLTKGASLEKVFMEVVADDESR